MLIDQLATKPEIIRVPVEGGKPEVIADLSSANKLTGMIDTWFCLAPDGFPCGAALAPLVRIYAMDWVD